MLSKNTNKNKEQVKQDKNKSFKKKRKKCNNVNISDINQNNEILIDDNKIQKTCVPISNSIHKHKKYNLREMLIASEIFNRKY